MFRRCGRLRSKAASRGWWRFSLPLRVGGRTVPTRASQTKPERRTQGGSMATCRTVQLCRPYAIHRCCTTSDLSNAIRSVGGVKTLPSDQNGGSEHHKKASEHLTRAARHHDEAAKHHEAASHEKAPHHSDAARDQVIRARGHAEEAVTPRLNLSPTFYQLRSSPCWFYSRSNHSAPHASAPHLRRSWRSWFVSMGRSDCGASPKTLGWARCHTSFIQNDKFGFFPPSCRFGP